MANPMNGYQQAITGTYTLQNIGGGIYNLIGGPSTITVTDGGPAVLQATATATQINFNNHTISWGAVNMGAIDVGIGSQSLIDLAANNASYAFTNFSFDAIANENQWLTGGSPNTNTPTVYRSRLEGFAAAPEPAEWMLMFIGLGMLGFYLQRRGYLTFDLSPQSAA
ncbi:MAG: PEP-CTERM sorting domain-containing protein [Deltaproteobacteria bacterium]|nr:PEP-CTERM sorting domain-containing protein [Deltaproteobacteria bacterium]